jgi:glycosyltransferase involved in cell wall biosynthesis
MDALEPAISDRSHVVLVGTGMDDSNQELMDLLDGHPWRARTHLLGRRSDVAGVMSAFDLNVLPSVAEAFPNVLAEAMACGTPCVATDTGDSALIVGDTGWVVPPRNSARLAEALTEAIGSLEDAAATHHRKEAARARISERFSLDRMVDAYADVWRAAVETRPIPR